MIKNSLFYELEQALIKWIHFVRETKSALDGLMVQEKATEFAGVSVSREILFPFTISLN